ncbi:MAG TPA: HipA domain-containing protein [Myxococcota bacterium]|nr:HipA domain-containing protein [Myxococcota bacterium]
MARPGDKSRAVSKHLDIRIGDQAALVGRLTFVSDSNRRYSTFSYDSGWLASKAVFTVSPDLALLAGHQIRKAPSDLDSSFFLALGDTEPDAWGRRVIARANARERRDNPALRPLSELDYLCAVDDFSRVGALRICDGAGCFLGAGHDGGRRTPPLVDLGRVFQASRAVEANDDSIEDLRYLQGRGTSLGGLRPKCTVLDEDGSLAIGKFPSISDQRSVTRGEVLAMRLAARAGIRAASARIVMIPDIPVAVIRRFDRASGGGRIHYWSASSMLQSDRGEDRSYTELVSAIARYCVDAVADSRELWRRIVFNHLITNTDDHLRNTGFLHVGGGLWRLSPAFDLNPFPDKAQESKTWLSEDTGPVTSIRTLIGMASRFYLSRDEALAILREILGALVGWKALSRNRDIGLSDADVRDFESAFDHEEMEVALSLVGR